MSHWCVLNQFPVEIFYILFDYFTSDEVFRTFFNINDYIDSIIDSYPNHRLHLKSIRKSEFDLLCSHIQPEQVISLILSDDDNTPGLSALLLSRFRLEQFTRLQSLTLIDIECDSLKSIMSNLHKIDHLRAFSFSEGSIRCIHSQQQCSGSFDVPDTFIQTFPQLNRLQLQNVPNVTFPSLSNLRHLKIEECSPRDLKVIFEHASQLRSLSTCLQLPKRNFNVPIPENRLIQLDLQIKRRRISMREMEEFLVQFPRLQHLELQAEAMSDVANGDRWKILVYSFETFQFKFDVRVSGMKNIRKSFSTSFWIHEKRWFICYNKTLLMSIPYFTLDTIDASYPPDIYTTILHRSVLLDRVERFIIDGRIITREYRLNHVKHIVLKQNVLVERLQSVVALTQVKHLTVVSLDQLVIFVPLEQNMPGLNELTINQIVNIDIVIKLRAYQYEQILKLTLTVSSEYNDYIYEELFRLFPCVQNLGNDCFVPSIKTMIRCIDGWKYLSRASFTSDVFKENMILPKPKRLQKEDFTYRFYFSDNSRRSCHWWIDEQKRTHLPRKYSSPRWTYYWHRIRYDLDPVFVFLATRRTEILFKILITLFIFIQLLLAINTISLVLYGKAISASV